MRLADSGRVARAGMAGLAVAALAVAGCGGDGGEVDSEFAAEVDAAAQTMLEAASASTGATAAYVAVSDPERGEYSQAYGTASVDGPEATLEDNYPIGSVTKGYTAVVVLQLVQDGDLALDDTVGELLPDLGQPDLESLTVEQLLSMTSGVADYVNVPDAVIAEVTDDPTRVWEPKELIAAGVGAGVDPAGTPGYSTTNYIVLQLIAESVAGEPLPDLIAERVTEPLGLDATFLPPPDDTTIPEPATRGYVAGQCVDEVEQDGGTIEDGTDTTDWNSSWAQGGGGMISTTADLLGWAESLTGNVLLDDDLAAERLQVAPIGGVDYGLGILQVGSWFGHEGEALGWEALAVQDPDTGVSVALATNGCGGNFTNFADFLDAIYPDGGAAAALLAGTSSSGADSGGGSTGFAEAETNFVAGDVVVGATWTTCSWDGAALALSAQGDGSSIEVVPAEGGAEVTVSGATEWVGTGQVDPAEGLAVVTGMAAPPDDPSAQVDFALVVNLDGCSP